MSGITGVFSQSSIEQTTAPWWGEMRRRTAQRGGHAEASWSTRGAADDAVPAVLLGQTWHAGDVGTGQPVTIAAGDGLAVVLDGVIYNAPDLWTELAGAAAVAESDAALVRRAYARWGHDVVTRLNGDFAFAIFDTARRELFCARDRIGIRPFYYADVNGGIAFGSEIKAVLAHPEVPADPDWRSLYFYAGSHYRYFDSRPDRTCFRAVRQLPHATCLVASLEGVRTWTYWTLDTEAVAEGSDDVVAGRLAELLDDAVRLRVRRATHPGFMLSSGMDSASVLSLASRALPGAAQVYSSSYDVEHEYDETREIRPAVEALRGQWHVIQIDGGELEPTLNAMLARHDEPVSTVTWLSHYRLARSAAEDGVNTLFGGLGGDELMAGEYEHFLYFFADLKQAGLDARLDREVSSWAALHDHPIFRKNRAVVDDVFQRLVDWQPAGTVRMDLPRYTAYRSALQGEFAEAFGEPPAMHNPFRSYLNNRCYQDLFYETTPCCLRADDRNVSGFGMRNAYPFLDHRVVELGFAIPPAMKYRDGVTKHVLRTAMRGIVPEANRARTNKVGWNAPAVEWLRSDWRQLVLDLIGSRSFIERGVYDAARVAALFDEHCSGRANHMMFFWQLVNVELWSRGWSATQPHRAPENTPAAGAAMGD